jgi:hypothetical protein
MPDTSEYLARIHALGRESDFVAVQKETIHCITDLVRNVPAVELARRPGPDRWSVVEIIAHLAEDELVTSWRYRQMLESDGAALAGFDQDLWARLGDYGTWSAEDALAMFRLLREANLRMLGRLSDQQWQCSGNHAERGQISVLDLARHMAGHDRNHLEQIRAILKR